MKLPQAQTLASIASLINATPIGDANFPILGINEIHKVEAGDIVFVDHPKYYDKALKSAATIVLINKEVDCPEGKVLLISDDPFRDFNKITQHYSPFQSASQSVSTTATIGEGTIIQPNVFVGNNVVIGKNCIIHPNVTIYDNSVIGDNVILHAGVVLGADAFYYKKRPEGYDKLLSGGKVVIKNNVEIGANTTIDKGVSGNTIIGEGTKIDNHIQIGHDTVVGKNCLFASHVGIAGCVIVEDNVTLWGQVGVSSGVTIGENAVVLGQSGVTKSIEGNKTYFGTPITDVRRKYREMASVRILPEIIENLNAKN